MTRYIAGGFMLFLSQVAFLAWQLAAVHTQAGALLAAFFVVGFAAWALSLAEKE